ncbi:tyrosine recombinase XerC [Spirillospora sp. NPDC048911]|uniref:site-specific integrase n=1 Tax=Spirillospora sp. NPDC048911 TaxID=3364527 RepID=UPI00371861D0
MAKILIGKYEGSIYQEGNGYTGALELGHKPDGKRDRLKRKGRNKTIVLDKLKKAVAELEEGVKSSPNYRVQDAVNDFLEAFATSNRSESSKDTYRRLTVHQIIPFIGHQPLTDLTAEQVDQWLNGRAKHLSTSTLAIVHSLLRRSLRRAMRFEKVGRNVAELVDTPSGQGGRPSKSFTLEQASTLMEEAAKPEHRLGVYVTLAVTSGLRTEELRTLKWADLDLDSATVYVLRADRHNGETKTKLSRRGLGLADVAIEALRALRTRQAAERLQAGEAYQDHDLVICHEDGTPYTANSVRYWFRKILTAAGLNGAEWCPRELRHTFVSLMSDHGVSIETISKLVGHKNTKITEEIYRHQLKPEIRDGAEHMNVIFKTGTAKSA